MLPRYLSGVRMRASMTGSSMIGDLLGIGELGGILDLHDLAVVVRDAVVDARRRRDEVEPEIPLEALLDDLPVEEAQESDPEPEPERGRILRLVLERGVR